MPGYCGSLGVLGSICYCLTFYHNHASEKKKELHVAGVIEGLLRTTSEFLGRE